MDEITQEPSELGSLLYTNAYVRKLTNAEFLRAIKLIVNPEYTDTLCWLCRMYKPDKANKSTPDKENKSIYDTGICSGHAKYALATRK